VVYSFVDGFERWISPWAGKLATRPTADDQKLLKPGKHQSEPQQPAE
jgi:hypothetical protein